MNLQERKVKKESIANYHTELANYIKQVSPVPSGIQGYYLSRFTVHSDYRGTGLSDKVLELFMGLSGDTFLLHVARDNDAAIKFYQRHEFEIVPESVHFGIMIKKVIGEARFESRC